jgi:hypothetical protein
MTANTSGMPRLFPSKTFLTYDNIVILTSTLFGLRLTALPNTPLTHLTVKIMIIESKKFSARGCVQFTCIVPYVRTSPQRLLVLELLFSFKTEFTVSITQFHKAKSWLRIMPGITATK